MTDGRQIPGSAYAEDDGVADPRLVEALAGYERGTLDAADVHQAVASCRLLVPVVAVLDCLDDERGERGGEKDSHMAVVLLTGRDRRQALLAFSGTHALARWNPDARPVPVSAGRAAAAAVAEGAHALLLDVAGPVPWVVTGTDLVLMARTGR